jgi:hypothetical protein
MKPSTKEPKSVTYQFDAKEEDKEQIEDQDVGNGELGFLASPCGWTMDQLETMIRKFVDCEKQFELILLTTHTEPLKKQTKKSDIIIVWLVDGHFTCCVYLNANSSFNYFNSLGSTGSQS